jgi:hypothetical protein
MKAFTTTTSKLLKTISNRGFSSLCTSCVHSHTKLACNPCQYLEDPDSLYKINYYQFFCLGEPHFDVNLKALNQQFKQYQKFIHPDKFEMVPTGKEQMKDRAHQISSFANNAYQILNNEIERAEYLMKL